MSPMKHHYHATRTSDVEVACPSVDSPITIYFSKIVISIDLLTRLIMSVISKSCLLDSRRDRSV